MIFHEGSYLTFKSIFHKALNLFKFDCEFTLKYVPGTKHYCVRPIILYFTFLILE